MTAQRNSGRVLRATALAAATTVGVAGCSIGLQDLPVGGVGTTFDVRAEMTTADGVVAGADVRSGQQVVGRVSDIALTGGEAVLTLALDKGTDVPANVTANVEIPSALGTPFIRLQDPENPQGRLAAGAEIGTDRTSVGPQVEGMLASLANVMNGSGLNQIESVMDSLNDAFAQRSDKIGDLVDTLNRLLATSSEYTDDFNKAMDAAANVSELFADQQDKIAEFLDETPRAVSVLSGQRDRIASLMTQTTNLAVNLDEITAGRQELLNGLVPDAQRLVHSLDVFNDNVGGTLTQMNGFMQAFTAGIKGDYMTFDGALDIPGSIDKILTGGLLASGRPLPTPKELEDVLTGGLTENKKKAATTTAPKRTAPSTSAKPSSAQNAGEDK